MTSENGTYTAVVAVENIKPHPDNYQGHPSDQIAEIQDSLGTYGYTRRMVIWEKGSGFICVAGHGVLTALKLEGYESVEATIIPSDWSEEQVMAYLVADNEMARMAHREDADLGKIIQLLGDQADVLPMGLDADEREALRTAYEMERGQGEEPEDEDAPAPEKTPEELQAEWGTKVGQWWEVGDHLLHCGDATSPKAWHEALAILGYEAFDGIITSPPYAEQRKARMEGAVKADDYPRWWMDTIEPLLSQHLSGDGSFFLNLQAHTDNGRRHTYDKRLVIAMEEAGWIYFEEFAWKKPGYPGKFERRFKNGWEPIHHLTRSVEPRANIESVFVEKESEIHAPWEPLREVQGRQRKPPREPVNIVRPSNVIEAHYDKTGVEGDEHPARFPVAVPAFLIKAYGFPGDLWLDPFSGTGSTGIACQRHGRRYVGFDLDPRWIAVQLQRFRQDFDLEGDLL